MAIIGFIRHGITDWNLEGRAQGISDVPLNFEGRKQAAKLAERVKGEGWELLFSSPLRRAVETAERIAAASEIPIHRMDERIREINCGQIEGLTEAERVERWGPDWHVRELGMERFADVADRGIDFLEDICKRYGSKRVLVVSHGALIGLTLQRLLPEAYPSTYIDNASLTILALEDGRWTCRLYNDTAHL